MAHRNGRYQSTSDKSGVFHSKPSCKTTVGPACYKHLLSHIVGNSVKWHPDIEQFKQIAQQNDVEQTVLAGDIWNMNTEVSHTGQIWKSINTQINHLLVFPHSNKQTTSSSSD